MQVVGHTWLILVTSTCGSRSEGQHDLYFMVQGIGLYLQDFFLCMNIILCDYESA